MILATYAGLMDMPENDPNQPEPSRRADPDPTDEDEVDRILAEAASLTEQLESEVGSEPPPAVPALDVNPVSADPVTVDLDSQLDRVEELLMGVEAPADEADKEPAPVGGEQQPEPTEHDQPPEEVAGDAGADVESGPADDDAGSEESETTNAGDTDVDAPDATPPQDLEETPQTTEGAAEPDTSESAVPEAAQAPDDRGAKPSPPARLPPPGLPRFATELLSSCERATFGFVDRLLVWMDAMDGAFTWISYDVRTIIGWVALALLVAACSITVYSLS